jgi:hypothetical protein
MEEVPMPSSDTHLLIFCCFMFVWGGIFGYYITHYLDSRQFGKERDRWHEQWRKSSAWREEAQSEVLRNPDRKRQIELECYERSARAENRDDTTREGIWKRLGELEVRSGTPEWDTNLPSQNRINTISPYLQRAYYEGRRAAEDKIRIENIDKKLKAIQERLESIEKDSRLKEILEMLKLLTVKPDQQQTGG